MVEMAKVDAETWHKFRKHCMAQQQLAPSTIEETIRKLKYLERNGIDLLNLDTEAVYDFLAEKMDEGAEATALFAPRQHRIASPTCLRLPVQDSTNRLERGTPMSHLRDSKSMCIRTSQ